MNILEQLGSPRDWPPQFPKDLTVIQAAIKKLRGIEITAQEAQSFWEEASDPDGWLTPPSDLEITKAFDRVLGTSS
jgi:hypothetical protein